MENMRSENRKYILKTQQKIIFVYVRIENLSRMYHACIYTCALVILCSALFEVINLLFRDRLIGYFLFTSIKNIDTSSHGKSDCPFFVICISKIHNIAQMFW